MFPLNSFFKKISKNAKFRVKSVCLLAEVQPVGLLALTLQQRQEQRRGHEVHCVQTAPLTGQVRTAQHGQEVH